MRQRSSFSFVSRHSTTLVLTGVLGVMLLVFCLINEDFRSRSNLVSMFTNISFLGITAAALTLVMVSGGLDISVGGTIALTTCVMAYLHNLPIPPHPIALIAIGLGVGAVVGTVNGLLITLLDLNPIITTLGTMSITRGIGYVLTEGRSVLMIEDVTGFIGTGHICGLPVAPILCVAVYVGLSVVLSMSKFGRKVYLVGANEDAAYLSGIPVKSVKFRLYLLSGIAASLGAVVFIGQSGVGMPQNAMGTELEAITAVLIGGTLLSGGSGTVLGTGIGVLIFAVLYNGLTMIGLRSVHISVFQGVLLVVIVGFYEFWKRRAGGTEA
jgi:ribose/xylose/arabinose/galactoside ABC-type transport system permease subunit